MHKTFSIFSQKWCRVNGLLLPGHKTGEKQNTSKMAPTSLQLLKQRISAFMLHHSCSWGQSVTCQREWVRGAKNEQKKNKNKKTRKNTYVHTCDKVINSSIIIIKEYVSGSLKHFKASSVALYICPYVVKVWLFKKYIINNNEAWCP